MHSRLRKKQRNAHLESPRTGVLRNEGARHERIQALGVHLGLQKVQQLLRLCCVRACVLFVCAGEREWVGVFAMFLLTSFKRFARKLWCLCICIYLCV